MKLLILSDLHLEQRAFSASHAGQGIDEHADLVILAGDIHEGVKGLRWARETFPDKPVLYVAGNHEFYGQNWSQNLDAMREAARTHDIAFLETDGVDIGGVRLLGCSLWTDFELFGLDRKSDALRAAKATMNDYQWIKFTRTPEFYWARSSKLLPELTVRRHQGCVEWLEMNLNRGEPAKTVVITHHAPHPRSIPAHFERDLVSAAYASDLSRLMGKATLWIHGHMHESADYSVGGTRVVCNPRGYLDWSGDFENLQFNPSLTIEV